MYNTLLNPHTREDIIPIRKYLQKPFDLLLMLMRICLPFILPRGRHCITHKMFSCSEHSTTTPHA